MPLRARKVSQVSRNGPQVASCYRNRDKLPHDRPLGSYVDLTLLGAEGMQAEHHTILVTHESQKQINAKCRSTTLFFSLLYTCLQHTCTSLILGIYVLHVEIVLKTKQNNRKRKRVLCMTYSSGLSKKRARAERV